jgi:hypothetical protein
MIPLVSRAIVAISSSLAPSIVIKITTIMNLALFAVRLARGSRAAVRHALLATVFGVVLVMPIVSLVSPPVHVAVPEMAESRSASLPPFGDVEPIPFFTKADARARGNLLCAASAGVFVLRSAARGMDRRNGILSTADDDWSLANSIVTPIWFALATWAGACRSICS